MNQWIELSMVDVGEAVKITINVNSIARFMPCFQYSDKSIKSEVHFIGGDYIHVSDTHDEIKQKIFVGDTELF